MPLTCPWSQFQLATLHFCEQPLCAWIAEPANTASNLAFLVSGVLILRRTARENSAYLKAFGWVAIAIGLASALFHATRTFFGEALDFGAMFLQSDLVIICNLKRLHPWRRGALPTIYAALLAGSMAILIGFEGWGILLFAAQILIWALLELYLFSRKEKTTDYRPLLALIALFALSYGIWWLDQLKLACNPQNHWINGHSIWHLFGALESYLWYAYYAQFRELGAVPGVGSGAAK